MYGMITWIPSIYTLYVSIYTSTMDPMGNYFFLLRGFPSNKQPPTATFWNSPVHPKPCKYLAHFSSSSQAVPVALAIPPGIAGKECDFSLFSCETGGEETLWCVLAPVSFVSDFSVAVWWFHEPVRCQHGKLGNSWNGGFDGNIHEDHLFMMDFPATTLRFFSIPRNERCFPEFQAMFQPQRWRKWASFNVPSKTRQTWATFWDDLWLKIF